MSAEAAPVPPGHSDRWLVFAAPLHACDAPRWPVRRWGSGGRRGCVWASMAILRRRLSVAGGFRGRQTGVMGSSLTRGPPGDGQNAAVRAIIYWQPWAAVNIATAPLESVGDPNRSAVMSSGSSLVQLAPDSTVCDSAT